VAPPASSTAHSGWAPLSYPDFRRLWTAQFVSNIGTWMQTVAAQWVMLSLTSSATLVASIGAAASLPVLLLGIPAGALGDLIDRKKLIAGSQLLMLLAATGLAGAAAAHALTPALLLALLFLIGCGSAASASTWQTLQPELVPGPARTEAIALGSVNLNLARAVGPALGGALLAASSAAVVFGVNAASFVAVLAAVALTAIPRRPAAVPPEHALDATRAGGRFVANSPALLGLIARAALFVFPAGATWALLPLVASNKLGLGSGGYGLLLGCVGLGAIGAATFGPGLRRRLSPRALYALAAALVAGAAAVLAASSTVGIDAVVLVVGGAAWILCLGLLGASYQSTMPPWVKARGMSYYLVAFQGSIAVGAITYGAVAEANSLDAGLLAVAGTLVVALAVTWPLPLPRPAGIDTHPVDPLPLPATEVAGDAGTIMVTIHWPVREDAASSFLALAKDLQRLRRRTGAISWRLYQSVEQPADFVETFIDGSWDEHMRQHARLYPSDAAVLADLDATLRPGETRSVEHSVAVTRSQRTAVAR
jgi:MFS family permease